MHSEKIGDFQRNKRRPFLNDINAAFWVSHSLLTILQNLMTFRIKITCNYGRFRRGTGFSSFYCRDFYL